MNYILVIIQNNKIRVEHLKASSRSEAYELANDFDRIDEMDYLTVVVLTPKESVNLSKRLLAEVKRL